MENFQLPISEEVKKEIYRAIQNGLLDMDEFVTREKLPFQNGFQQLKWAYIFTRIYHDLHIENGEVIRGKRGPWPLVMIYDEATSFVYVVLKKKNFNLLQRSVGKKKVPHYIEALSVYNNGFEDEIDSSQIEPYQLQMEIELDQESIEKVLISLLGNLKSEVKRFVIITFESKNNTLEELYALIPNGNLDIIYQEDWSRVIEVEYAVEEGFSDHQENEQDDILLTFIDDTTDIKDKTGE